MSDRLPTSLVDTATVERFERDGAVVVRGLATPDELAAVARGIERVLAEPKTSPDFAGLADELPAGAPMDHPLFPVVWPG